MLDYLTALVILAAAALTVAAGLLVAWWRDRTAIAFLWWAGGFCSVAAGMALVVADLPIAEPVAVGLANFLVLLSFTGWIWGAQRLGGRPLGPEGLLPAAVWLASVAIPDISGSFHLRFALLNVGTTIGYGLLCRALWPRASGAGEAETASSRRPMAIFLLLAAIWSLVIAVAGLLLRPSGLDDFALAWLDGIVEVLILLVIVIYGARLIRERAEARLHALAQTDPLTGILNRRGLGDRLERLLARAAGADERIALLLFDLDHFKQVNDRHGHDAGDQVLRAFCRRAEGQLRPTDLFGRLGGEEFAAVLRVEDIGQAEEAAERIRLAVAQLPVEAGNRLIPVTVSVGVAILRHDGAGAEPAFGAADSALYAAKAAGRNRVEVVPELAAPDGLPRQRETPY